MLIFVSRKNNKPMKIVIFLYIIMAFPQFALPMQDKVVKDTSGWKKIGISNINFKNSNDDIYVLESDKYSSVKFAVTDMPIDITALEIFYETGDKQDIRVNLELNDQGESKPIELNGGERRLTKITFAYKPLNENSKKGVVELWGMKAKNTP
jgi:hypothetical protein